MFLKQCACVCNANELTVGAELFFFMLLQLLMFLIEIILIVPLQGLHQR
jgi:hypothetical protein